MRRAITLIVVLTVMCLGLGLWLDLTQRHTAREYLDALCAAVSGPATAPGRGTSP